MLYAEQMRLLPQCFAMIADPRSAQGRCHRLLVVLGIVAGAVLCGMQWHHAAERKTPHAPIDGKSGSFYSLQLKLLYAQSSEPKIQ